MIVFLVAYGVTSQALLYPNENRVGQAIAGIFYKPYWQLFGDLFLNELNYDPGLYYNISFKPDRRLTF